MKYNVSSSDHGKSLFDFLREKVGEACSGKALKRAIADKSCRVNGKTEVFSSRKLASGEEVEFTVDSQSPPSHSLPVLWEDADFCFVDKPPGLVCVSDRILREGSFPPSFELVHRLDKETSGVLFLAKTPRALVAAKKLFSERDIEKEYLAIVDGIFPEDRRKISTFFIKKGEYQGQTLYGSTKKDGGVLAVTEVFCLARGRKASFLRCLLQTGRTHQIRVHLSELSHPILGDCQYGIRGFASDYPAKRHLLHARSLAFRHPFTRKKIVITSPIPRDFSHALQTLGLMV